MTAQKKTERVQSVNSQITDAITQANTLNLGLAPALSIGTLYQTTSQAVGTSIQNAVSNQHNMYSLNLASLTQNITSILALSPAAKSRASSRNPHISRSAHHSAPVHHVYSTTTPRAAVKPASETKNSHKST